MRQRGLDPELTSFLFKLLHGILPTSARVNRILQNSSSFCARCDGSIVEDLEHALVYCEANGDVGHTLLALVAHFTDINVILSVTDVLTFNFESSTNDHTFSLIWLLGKTFLSMWIKRCEKKQIRKVEIISEIEAQLKIVEKTNITNAKVIIRDLLDFFTNF